MSYPIDSAHTYDVSVIMRYFRAKVICYSLHVMYNLRELVINAG